MKIIVLTTQTPHHTYFVQRLRKSCLLDKVIAESKVIKPNFETHHPFEDLQDTYERQVFFGGKDVLLGSVSKTLCVDSVNGSDSITYLKQTKPNIIIVFGTGKILPELIRICPDGIINLHGGDPQKYRGLDSHLWAVYNKDFSSLAVTLHRVNEKLDDGQIISQKKLAIVKGMPLYQLRRFTTEACVDLVLSATDSYAKKGEFTSFPQLRRGQYYSFMPAGLKDNCVQIFEQYTGGLSEVNRKNS